MRPIVATVEAYVEIDLEQLVEEILKVSDLDNKSQITRELINEYIGDNVSYLRSRRSDCLSIDVVSDGPSISRVSDETLRVIEKYINGELE